MVIGLNLCPFARRVFEAERIRYVVSDVTDSIDLLDVLAAELRALVSTRIEEVETTMLIHPQVLRDFAEYNDFLDAADALLARLKVQGVIQIASFHPAYQFADTEPDDVENYTNRSPYPMLHLLREESISQVAEDEDALLAIPERNIETLRRLGRAAVLARLAEQRGQG